MSNYGKILYKKLQALGIEKSKCKSFIPSKNNPELCECGLELYEHKDQIDLDASIKEWSVENCTAPDGITDAYGEVLFDNKNDEPTKYIRVYHKTEMEKILNLLFSKNYWALSTPKLLISVTGGAKLNMSKILKNILCKGLVKVATSTNGWITTGATYGGIMKEIGIAARNSTHSKQQLVLLGIANWTTVTNNDFLIRKFDEKLENKPVSYEFINSNANTKLKSAFLDPNHSHLILVDNSKFNKFGGEIQFRAELESKISTIKSVPIVLVVVEGGPNTVDTVSQCLDKNIPCVIIDKSGKISNILSDVYKQLDYNEEFEEEKNIRKAIHTEVNGIFKFEPEFRAGLFKKLQNEFGQRDYSIDDIISKIENIFKQKTRNLITIFELDSTKKETDLDEAILNAFSKANKKSKMAELCLSWNRVDIARQSIFNDDFQENMNIFDDLMYSAILKNRIEFVNLLLENGFSLKNFLTYQRYLKLYEDLSQLSESNLITGLFRKKFKIDLTQISGIKSKISFKNVGRIIQNLVDDLFKHEFTKEPFESIDLKQMSNDYLIDSDDPDKQEDLRFNNFNNPEHQLFMLSILLGKFELSKIFWREGKNQISSALVANKILKKMAKTFDEMSTELLDMANKYELLAYKALTLSNDLNESKTQYLLIRSIDEYSGITCLQIAKSAKCMNFMSHPVCQKFLIKIWYHKIYPETASWKIYLCMLFPLAAPLLNYYEDKKKQKPIAFFSLSNKKATTIKENSNNTNNEMSLKSSKITRKIESLDSNQSFSYFSYIKHFLKAPYVKFVYSQVSFLMFLILFSYVMLCDFYPIYANVNKPTHLNTVISIPEIVLIIWMFTFAFDELQKFFLNEHRVMNAKFKSFFTDFQEILEIFAIFLFYVAIILRFIPDYNCYLAARIILSIDILYWYIRSLYAYSFVKKLGPKLLMIRKMAVNLAYFFLIILVLFFAFGISTQALIYPNQPLDINLLKQVFFPSYFVLEGDYYTLATIRTTTEDCVPTDDTPCPDYIGAQVMLGIYVIYLIFLNILVLNILIALFNQSYSSIQKEADPLWKFQRYALVFDYFHKPIVPPPFIIFYYIGILFKLLINLLLKLFNETQLNTNKILKFFVTISKIYVPGFYYNFKNPEEENKLIKWESYIADELIFHFDKESNEQKEVKLNQTIEKLELLNFKQYVISLAHKEAKKKLENLLKKLNSLNSKDHLILSSNDVKPFLKKENIKPELVQKIEKTEFKRSDTSSTMSSKISFPDREVSNLIKPKSNQPPENYKPIKFTSDNVLQNINADPDLFSYPHNNRPNLEFNKYDKNFQINRKSCLIYDVLNGFPQNPLGKTGIIGRGNLFYWGPNHGIEAIFTRYRKINGEIVKNEKNEKILEIIMVEKDQNEFSIPHLLISNLTYSDNLIARRLLSKIFDENFLNENKTYLEKLIKLIQSCKHIDKYVSNGSQNTDNSWVEYYVLNYHDDAGLFHDIQLKNEKLTWKVLDVKLEALNSKHLSQSFKYLRRVCLSRDSLYE